MKTNTNKGLVATLIITLSLMAVLSIITWVIPFPNNTTAGFLTTYICSMVLILAEGILTSVVFFKKNDKSNKILGLPIIHFGIVAVIVQLVITTIVYVVNCFVEVPAWIVAIVECLVYIITIIHVTFGFFFKKRTEDFKSNNQSLRFIEKTRVRIQVLLTNNENKDVAKALESLYDTIRATDPVSNAETSDVEARIASKVTELSEKIDENGSTEEILLLIKSLEKLIKERGAYCKLGK